MLRRFPNEHTVQNIARPAKNVCFQKVVLDVGLSRGRVDLIGQKKRHVMEKSPFYAPVSPLNNSTRIHFSLSSDVDASQDNVEFHPVHHHLILRASATAQL